MNLLPELKQNIEKIDKNGTYIISYPHIISYFEALDMIQKQDLIRGTHMVYGWMPTILNLYINSGNITLFKASQLLTEVKNGKLLTKLQINKLSSLINKGQDNLTRYKVSRKYHNTDEKQVCLPFPHFREEI